MGSRRQAPRRSLDSAPQLWCVPYKDVDHALVHIIHMASLPDGDTQSYARLKNRAVTALDFNDEQPGIEFKRSQTWQNLWIALTKTSMAMSNLRDGGIIIVGRPDDNSPDGMTSNDLVTYDPDTIRDKIDEFASPGVGMTIVRITHNGNTFLVIEVTEFTEVPIVCRKTYNRDLEDGAFYILPLAGRPCTRRVRSADEMRDIFNRTVQKGLRRFHESAQAAGYVPAQSSVDSYRKELGGLADA
jgi:hypothetical protein